MMTYREVVDGAAEMLHGRLINPQQFNIDLPIQRPCDLRGELNPHPRIVCDDETTKLLCAVILSLSGGSRYARWSAVSYRWLRFTMLSFLRGERRAQTLLSGLFVKNVPFLEDRTRTPKNKPNDEDIGDFHWALNEMLTRGEIAIIHHRGEDYICPTHRILRYTTKN